MAVPTIAVSEALKEPNVEDDPAANARHDKVEALSNSSSESKDDFNEELKEEIDQKIDKLGLQPDLFYHNSNKLFKTSLNPSSSGGKLMRQRAYSSQEDLSALGQSSTAGLGGNFGNTSQALESQTQQKLMQPARPKGLAEALAPNSSAQTSAHSPPMDGGKGRRIGLEESKDTSSSQPPPTNEFCIYPNKKTTLIFQFLYHPEYLGLGNKIIVNTDNFKAFGIITQITPEKIVDECMGKHKGSQQVAATTNAKQQAGPRSHRSGRRKNSTKNAKLAVPNLNATKSQDKDEEDKDADDSASSPAIWPKTAAFGPFAGLAPVQYDAETPSPPVRKGGGRPHSQDPNNPEAIKPTLGKRIMADADDDGPDLRPPAFLEDMTRSLGAEQEPPRQPIAAKKDLSKVTETSAEQADFTPDL